MPKNDRTMFLKSLGVDQNQDKSAISKHPGVSKLIQMDGGLRTKIQSKDTGSESSGVPKPIYNDGGLRPAKSDDSKALEIKMNRWILREQ